MRTVVWGVFFMQQYTKDDDGRLNNFAREPKMYQAEPIDADQKRNYLIIASVGAFLVVGLIALASVIS
jgi:hypothetical protein